MRSNLETHPAPPAAAAPPSTLGRHTRHTRPVTARNALVALVTLVTLVTGLSTDARAGFEWANPRPTGNDLGALLLDEAGTAYAVGEFGTVLRSDDLGVSWTLLAPPAADAPSFFDVIALAPGHLLAAGSAPGLHLSLDGGLSWQPVDNPANTTLRNIFALDATHIFAVGDQGRVVRSTDGGVSFQSLTGLGSQLVDQFWLDEQTGYVIGPNRLRRTTNGGTTWAAVPGLSESGIGFPGDIQFSNANDGWILVDFATHRTTNGGATWTTRNVIPPNAPIYLEEAVVLDPSTLIVATEAEGAEIWRTTNDGATWSVALQRDGSRGITDLIRWPDGALGAISSDGDLLRSTDAGQTWTTWNQVAGVITRADLNAIDLLPSGLGFAGGNQDLWLQTTDGGATWFDPPSGPSIAGTFCLTVRDPLFVLAGGSDQPGKSEVRRTTDGGVTWTNHPLSAGYVGYPQGLVAFPDGTCFTGTYGGAGINFVYRSTDHGATWHLRSSGYPSSKRITGITFLDPLNGWVYGGDFGSLSLYRTTDGGANWSIAPQGGLVLSSVSDLHWFNQSVGIAVADNRIQRTTNGGVLWGTVALGSAAQRMDFDGSRGVVSGFDAVAQTTTDAGLTWQTVNIPSSNFWSDVALDLQGFHLAGGNNALLRYREATAEVAELAPPSLRLWPNPASRGTTSFHLALAGVQTGSELQYRWIDPSGRATRPLPLGPASSSGVYELRSASSAGALDHARGHAHGRARSGVQFLELLDGTRVVAREKVVQIR